MESGKNQLLRTRHRRFSCRVLQKCVIALRSARSIKPASGCHHLVDLLLGERSREAAGELLKILKQIVHGGDKPEHLPSEEDSLWHAPTCLPPVPVVLDGHGDRPAVFTHTEGYTYLMLASVDAVPLTLGLHRFSCWLACGDPPTEDHTHACHACRNKPCVRPACLRWGTPRDNRRDHLRA